MTTPETTPSIDAATLKNWRERGDLVLIDVREPGEFAARRIPGARLNPLSSLDFKKISPQGQQKTVLMCRTGNRSEMAARRLTESGFGDIYNLEGGIEAWVREGGEIEGSGKEPLSLQRQVQIVAGTLILLGAALSLWVSPWFLALSAFVGAGLLFAGLSGSCGMAMLLARLPFNRRALP